MSENNQRFLEDMTGEELGCQGLDALRGLPETSHRHLRWGHSSRCKAVVAQVPHGQLLDRADRRYVLNRPACMCCRPTFSQEIVLSAAETSSFPQIPSSIGNRDEGPLRSWDNSGLTVQAGL